MRRDAAGYDHRSTTLERALGDRWRTRGCVLMLGRYGATFNTPIRKYARIRTSMAYPPELRLGLAHSGSLRCSSPEGRLRASRRRWCRGSLHCEPSPHTGGWVDHAWTSARPSPSLSAHLMFWSVMAGATRSCIPKTEPGPDSDPVRSSVPAAQFGPVCWAGLSRERLNGTESLPTM